MSYRIVTYRDPYHLDNTSIWDEIYNLPHFCASSVMAMSMWDLYHTNTYGPRFSSFFFPLDDFVSNSYDEWEGNVEKQIAQYSTLTWWLDEWEKTDRGRRPKLFSALRQNQNSLLDSLRMFCELNISPESLHKELANTEQKVFITLYRYITNFEGNEVQTRSLQEAFALTDSKIHRDEAFPALLSYEINEELSNIDRLKKQQEQKDSDEIRQALKKRDARVDRLKDMAASYANNPFRKIVVHGIHQFKPLQMRLIAALNEAGYEIIFLFNYLEEYHHLYETWERMYSLFGVPIEHSTVVRAYESIVPDKTSMELAGTMAKILNGQSPVKGEERISWMELAGKIDCTVFENTSEMANQVAVLIREHKDENTPNERIIYKLPEKIYSASRDADDLLKVYFPEYAGDRHFLQYPVGQFFANLYQMWDEDKRQLMLDIPSMKACAVSGVVSPEGGEQLSRLLDLVAPLIEDLTLFSDVEQRLTGYQKEWTQAQIGSLKGHLKHVALYNKEQINEKEIQDLLDFLNELREAAETIFNQRGSINFKNHFENLEKYIRGRADHLVQVEEKKLVNDLLLRFEQVEKTTNMTGTMDDLRQGLYFYMAQKKKEKPGWVIRNFEQIEGDVLKSQAQVSGPVKEGKEDITYHFAALSDGMICKKTDELLPWPLTDHFTHAVYSPVALVFQVYYCALNDRQAYMQYALFYGLQFNRGKVKLSYIRHIDEKKEEQLYYPLQILNLKRIEYHSEENEREPELGGPEAPQKLRMFDPTRDAKMDFYLCPYRYYLDFICSSEIVHDSPFMIRKFYESMLSAVFRTRYQNRRMNGDQVRNELLKIQDELDPYFPFLKNVNDKPDIRENAAKYIMSNLMDGGRVREDDPYHTLIRETFIKGVFHQPEDSHEEHPVEPLRSYVQDDPRDNGRGGVENRKKYSLASILQLNQRNPVFMKEYMADYLLNETDRWDHAGVWCTYCRYKGLCKKPFVKAVEE